MNFLVELNSKSNIKNILTNSWVRRNDFMRFLRYTEDIIHTMEDKGKINTQNTFRYRIEFEDRDDYYYFNSLKPVTEEYLIQDIPELIRELAFITGTNKDILKFKIRKQEVVKAKSFIQCVIKLIVKELTFSRMMRYMKTDHATLLNRVKNIVPGYIYSNDPEMMNWIEKTNRRLNTDIIAELKSVKYLDDE